MHSDLVRSAGFQIALYHRAGFAEYFKSFIVGNGKFSAVFDNCHFFAVEFTAPDGGFDSARKRIDNSVNYGNICSFDRMFGKLFA